MKTNNYGIASTFLFISAVITAISKWGAISGPYIEDRILLVFSVICLAGLGLINLKRYSWMKWVLLLILIFEFLTFYDVIRFQSQLTQILTMARIVLFIAAAILLFFAKDLKKQEQQQL